MLVPSEEWPIHVEHETRINRKQGVVASASSITHTTRSNDIPIYIYVYPYIGENRQHLSLSNAASLGLYR